jgi:hypothetical protein
MLYDKGLDLKSKTEEELREISNQLSIKIDEHIEKCRKRNKGIMQEAMALLTDRNINKN